MISREEMAEDNHEKVRAYKKQAFMLEKAIDKLFEERSGIIKRQWGHYKVLHRGDGFTVKELTILPGKSLSDQRHFKRDEHWLLVKGRLKIEIESPKPFEGGKLTISLQEKNYPENWNTAGTTLYEGINCLDIPKGYWHRPHNEGTENVVVVETWIGESSEEDIERRDISTIPPLP